MQALRTRFSELALKLHSDEPRAYALAELSDFLEGLNGAEVSNVLAEAPPIPEDPVWANYLAAMVETALHRKPMFGPTWLAQIPPLKDPWFASNLVSLRLYLLCVSPPAFKMRNLFVDSTIGDRV